MTFNSSSTVADVTPSRLVFRNNYPISLHLFDKLCLSHNSEKLIGVETYMFFSRAMYVLLLVKSKLNLWMDLAVKIIYELHPHQICYRCNALVFAWIMHFVFRKLMTKIIYSCSVYWFEKILNKGLTKWIVLEYFNFIMRGV